MAKHIKTNKIKKRKAAKKTLRKTKRIRQKGKKQSGGISLWGKSSECSDTKTPIFYTYKRKELTKELTKEMTKKTKEEKINNIIKEMINDNLSNIKSKLHGKEEVANTIVTDVIQYWLNALNGNDSDKIKYRPYFGSSRVDSKNPLIKICIMKKNETGAAILQNPYSGFFRSGDRYVKLKPFEENDQFKNYEIYQSEPNTQIYTNNNPKKTNNSQEYVKNLWKKQQQQKYQQQKDLEKEDQEKEEINKEFNEKYDFIKTNNLENYYYYNFPCRSSIRYMSGTKDKKNWKNNKYYILHPKNIDNLFDEEEKSLNEKEALAKEIEILTDPKTNEPVKLTGNEIDKYFPKTDDDDDRRENYIAAREINQPIGKINIFGMDIGIGDSCIINENEQ